MLVPNGDMNVPEYPIVVTSEELLIESHRRFGLYMIKIEQEKMELAWEMDPDYKGIRMVLLPSWK